jgi:hypothetical protein
MKKNKNELSMCSKNLDNPTYGLFKKPGSYNISTFLCDYLFVIICVICFC